MIISRTPFRISFFGGGTDYPQWYLKESGAVLSTSIDKYCYISCRLLPPFFSHSHRIVYSQIENVSNFDEIQHPSVRETLKFFNYAQGLEIHHDGDLPARSGLGSSSSFTVGLINVLKALGKQKIEKKELAQLAIKIEQDMIQENVGSQDQIAVSHGGLNKIEFNKNGSFNVTKVNISSKRKILLNNHLLLFFTGFSRVASDIAGAKIRNLAHRKKQLYKMRELVDEGLAILENEHYDILRFGQLLDISWRYKQELSKNISNFEIDEIYRKALSAGAIGGKLLGAGGGGFIMFFADPSKHNKIKETLADLIFVPFKFENNGSIIVLNQPNGL